MEGLLLVDKPVGWTSFDVVNYVRRHVAEIEGKKPKQVKVGHSGTLDPFASGLLILLVGKAYTRQADTFLKLDKRYIVTAQLGMVSSTGDPEGKLQTYSRHQPDYATIIEKAKQLTGSHEQTPPAYSAIKINGQRAYHLARQGQPVQLEPRLVTIHDITITGYSYPDITFTTDVSSGTYIRSLVEELGQALGTGAYTTQLRRDRIGQYQLDQAYGVDSLDLENLNSRLQDRA